MLDAMRFAQCSLSQSWKNSPKYCMFGRREVIFKAQYTLATKSTVSATTLNVNGNSRLCCRFVAGFG